MATFPLGLKQPKQLIFICSLNLLAQSRKALCQVQSSPGQESSNQMYLGTFLFSSLLSSPLPFLFANDYAFSGKDLMSGRMAGEDGTDECCGFVCCPQDGCIYGDKSLFLTNNTFWPLWEKPVLATRVFHLLSRKGWYLRSHLAIFLPDTASKAGSLLGPWFQWHSSSPAPFLPTGIHIPAEDWDPGTPGNIKGWQPLGQPEDT